MAQAHDESQVILSIGTLNDFANFLGEPTIVHHLVDLDLIKKTSKTDLNLLQREKRETLSKWSQAVNAL